MAAEWSGLLGPVHRDAVDVSWQRYAPRWPPSSGGVVEHEVLGAGSWWLLGRRRQRVQEAGGADQGGMDPCGGRTGQLASQGPGDGCGEQPAGRMVESLYGQRNRFVSAGRGGSVRSDTG